MSSALIRPQVRTACRAHAQALAGLPAKRAWEGFSFTPTRGQAFVEDKLAVISREPRSIGAIQHQFSYILTLKFPSNDGTADIEALGGALVDHFKVGTKLSSDGQSVLCLKAEDRGAIETTADWAVLTVTVTLQAFTTD